MTKGKINTQHIAIVGGGFSGVALAAALHRYAKQPIEIYLFEKSGQFGAGDAYRTPYVWHLLNARAGEMSALQDEPDQFVRWLQLNAATYLDTSAPHARQFVPRVLYSQYLCSLMTTIFRDESGLVKLHLIPDEIVDLTHDAHNIKLTSSKGKEFIVDHSVLAIGNNPPARMPYSMPQNIQCIENPWDYTALKNIPKDAPVMIVGTGLSMIDAVLTLHHQHHRGKIFALSRRGLLPLPHTEHCHTAKLDINNLPRDVKSLMKVLRAEADRMIEAGEDWRGIMQQIRCNLQDIWAQMDERNKKRFMRHVLSYWNVHRHRVHEKLSELLNKMQQAGQLEIMSGRLIGVSEQGVTARLRHQQETKLFPVTHLINCMGSSNHISAKDQPMLAALMQRGNVCHDELKLGLLTNRKYELITAQGKVLPACYTLGPPMRGVVWECVAVPEIRQQCKELAQQLLS